MKCNWEDLPNPLSCFTIRNATMVNLNTGRIVSNYAANTKIVVVQRCVTEKGTYYRTNEATHHSLNYAFKASDFGLPNFVAPSAHSSDSNPTRKHTTKSESVTRTKPTIKQKSAQKTATPKDGEEKRFGSWLKKIFRRENGKSKNS